VSCIELRIDQFNPDSEFAKGVRYKSISADMPWFIYIEDLTKQRSMHSPAIPLNHGEHGYLIFTRENG
jgi:hypothetical protein